MKLTVEERKVLERVGRAQRKLEKAIPWERLYDSAFILENPIPAGCVKCGYYWTKQDAIRAPTLANCSCFWCHGTLVALDLSAYRERLANLHAHVVPYQAKLEFA